MQWLDRAIDQQAHDLTLHDGWNTHRYGDLKGTETLWECAQATGTQSH